MKYLDVRDFVVESSTLLSYLEKENVVLVKKGAPVAVIKKFDDTEDKNLPLEAANKISNPHENYAAQYAAMMEVWGDPECDAYDEAFMDD